MRSWTDKSIERQRKATVIETVAFFRKKRIHTDIRSEQNERPHGPSNIW